MPRRSHRDTLLEAGSEVLETAGFHAAGVQRIATAAGVPKGSFYNHFASKDAFAAEVLRRYGDAYLGALEAALVDASGTPRERLAALFDGWIEQARERRFARGCLAGNLCQELADSHPELRDAVEQIFRSAQRALAEVIFEAQQAGEASADLDPDELAGFLYNAWQGALLRSKATRSDRPLQQFRDIALGRILALADS